MTAPTDWYVDPSIAANSGTGVVGDPYGDFQYALDQKTHDATNGTRFNIKAGTAENLAGTSLNFTGYGTSVFTAAAPFIVQGYTTAQGDGGIGEVDCNGATTNGFINSITSDFVYLYDMKIGGNTSGHAVYFDNNCIAYNCEIHNSAGDGIRFGLGSHIKGCYIHDIASQGCQVEAGSHVTYCRFIAGATKDFATYAIFLTGYGGLAHRNIIDLSATTSSTTGIGSDQHNTITNNSIYAGTVGTGAGIKGRTTQRSSDISNNLIEGFNGTGGKGIVTDASGHFYLDGNGCYNNATNYDTVAGRILYGDTDNDVLGASPFTSASTGDFTPVDADNNKDGNLPSKIGVV